MKVSEGKDGRHGSKFFSQERKFFFMTKFLKPNRPYIGFCRVTKDVAKVGEEIIQKMNLKTWNKIAPENLIRPSDFIAVGI